MLAAYLDESSDPHVLAMGGYVINSTSDDPFQKDWAEVCHRHNISALHMNEFVPPYGKLSHLTQVQRIALFRDAIEVLRTYALCGFAVSFNKSEFETIAASAPGLPKVSLQRGSVQQPVSAFAILFGACIHLAASWAISHGRAQEEISAVLDRGAGYGEHARLMFHDMKYFQWETSYELHKLRFDDDEQAKPLQAADMLAYEARKEFGRRLGKHDRQESQLLKALLGSKVPHWCGRLPGAFLQWIAGGIHPVDRFQRIKPNW